MASKPRATVGVWRALLAGLLAAGCGGASPASPAEPTVMGPTPAPLTTTARTAAATPAEAGTPTAGTSGPAGSGGFGGSGGSATVQIGGETYELITGEPPVCAMDFGIQASMASADRRASLDLYTAGSTVGSFIFARVLDGELWQPAGDPPPFEVSGSNATWTGTMRDMDSGREEQVTISISCGD